MKREDAALKAEMIAHYGTALKELKGCEGRLIVHMPKPPKRAVTGIFRICIHHAAGLQNVAGEYFTISTWTGKMVSGGMAVATLDAVKLMKMLVDQEMEIYHDLDLKVVFLQNIIVDLMLGYDVAEPFVAYCQHIRKKYGAYPGLITQNLPLLRRKLIEWGIEDVVICASINKIGYLMSPGVEEYERVLAENNGTKYPVMAMSTLASGAVPPVEAYEYINKLNVQSVVFGASSPGNIKQTVSLIEGAPA